MKLSKAALSTLAMIVASGSVPAQAQTLDRTPEAALAVNELIEGGYIVVEPRTGKITLNGTVLEILEQAGVVKKSQHGELSASACSSTTGIRSSSPSSGD